MAQIFQKRTTPGNAVLVGQHASSGGGSSSGGGYVDPTTSNHILRHNTYGLVALAANTWAVISESAAFSSAELIWQIVTRDPSTGKLTAGPIRVSNLPFGAQPYFWTIQWYGGHCVLVWQNQSITPRYVSAGSITPSSTAISFNPPVYLWDDNPIVTHNFTEFASQSLIFVVNRTSLTIQAIDVVTGALVASGSIPTGFAVNSDISRLDDTHYYVSATDSTTTLQMVTISGSSILVQDFTLSQTVSNGTFFQLFPIGAWNTGLAAFTNKKGYVIDEAAQTVTLTGPTNWPIPADLAAYTGNPNTFSYRVAVDPTQNFFALPPGGIPSTLPVFEYDSGFQHQYGYQVNYGLDASHVPYIVSSQRSSLMLPYCNFRANQTLSDGSGNILTILPVGNGWVADMEMDILPVLPGD